MPRVKNLFSVNAYLFAVAAQPLKLYVAVNKCKQRIVTAVAYVVARVYMCTALANEDVTGKYKLPVGPFYA